jgi:hypothetical protein
LVSLMRIKSFSKVLFSFSILCIINLLFVKMQKAGIISRS